MGDDESGDFYHDLLREILLRLPPKSLLRLRSVCSLWFSTIVNPDFIEEHRSHFIHSQHHNNYRTVTPRQERIDFEPTISKICLLPDNSELIHTSIRYWEIMGSCNSIFSYIERGKTTLDYGWKSITIILCNPSIRRTISLPTCPFMNDAIAELYKCGIGFDSAKNDYKVLIMRKPIYVSPLVNVALFSLNSMSWERLDSPVMTGTPVGISIFLHGFIHWLCREKSPAPGFSVIKFDVSNKVFGTLRLPEMPANNRPPNQFCVSLYVVNGSLCVMKMSRKRYVSCEVWVMKEYGVESWTQLFKVVLKCCPISGHLTVGGKLILWSRSAAENGKLVDDDGNDRYCFGNWLILYDPVTHEFSNLCPADEFPSMVSLVPSLELLTYKP